MEREKVAERKSDSERKEGIRLKREFAVNGIKSSKTARGVGTEE